MTDTRLTENTVFDIHNDGRKETQPVMLLRTTVSQRWPVLVEVTDGVIILKVFLILSRLRCY